MEKTLKIISPTEAKELNPYGEKPVIKTNDMFLEYANVKKLEQWQAAESSLKTYRITNIRSLCNEERHFLYRVTEFVEAPAYIGHSYLFKINDKDLTVVIL